MINLVLKSKKHITYSEHSLVNDLLKVQDLKKKIIAFDISSKIILVSLKENLKVLMLKI